MQNQNSTTVRKLSRNSSSQETNRRPLPILNREWDAQFNQAPVVKAPQGWNKDYPDVERHLSFH
ncbi:hypothetical protein LJB81_01345 [Desulfovibrio sp. OttesenSCG-928-M14]|nr:hypothetical protein [Desulfovibrio sp. OttesenSCG-928-M14]